MQITTVTVGWSETCSLPGYNNIHPSVTMTATVDAGESAERVVDVLMDACKAKVQAEVDIALRRRGCRPQYEPPKFGGAEILDPWPDYDTSGENEDDDEDQDDRREAFDTTIS